MFCVECGKAVNTEINGIPICFSCQKKREQERLRNREDEVKEARDFKEWNMADMSELFWIHLGIYQKTPNQKSCEIMKSAYLWAVHANKGLANSFNHAMQWIGITNIQMECWKWKDKVNT